MPAQLPAVVSLAALALVGSGVALWPRGTVIGAAGEPPTNPGQAPAASPSAAPPATKPGGGPGSGPSGNPDETMRDLEKAAEPKPAPSKTTTQPTAPAPGAPLASDSAVPGVRAGEQLALRPGQGRLIREGSFITSRRGRMVRGSSGEWLFSFDADAKAQNLPPMTLQPCQNLMAMEKLAERGGDGLTFTLSGQVFVYHGKNYVLPTLYVVNRPSADLGR